VTHPHRLSHARDINLAVGHIRPIVGYIDMLRMDWNMQFSSMRTYDNLGTYYQQDDLPWTD